MQRKHIVVVGSSFAGFTAALELKKELGDRHDVTVIAKTDRCVFIPSLVGVPFGLHSTAEITSMTRPPLEQVGVRFRHDEVTRLSLPNRTVTTKTGDEHYDYLVIATGPKPNYAAIPGLGPRGYTQSIMTPADAERARTAFVQFLSAPGPVVVGGVQGTTCLEAAYEFLFSMAHQLGAHSLTDTAKLTFITPELHLSYPASSGLERGTLTTEALFQQLQIHAITNAAVRKVTQNEIHLVDGRKLPFAFAMLVPPFLGVDPVRACLSITDACGFVVVNDYYQTLVYPEVFAAGVAVATASPNSSLPHTVAKTGYLSEEMARVAARNIAAQIQGTAMLARPASSIEAKCILDADDSCIRSLTGDLGVAHS